MLTRQSAPPDAKKGASGCEARHITPSSNFLLWAPFFEISAIVLKVRISHTLIVPSWPPLTKWIAPLLPGNITLLTPELEPMWASGMCFVIFPELKSSRVKAPFSWPESARLRFGWHWSLLTCYRCGLADFGKIGNALTIYDCCASNKTKLELCWYATKN